MDVEDLGVDFLTIVGHKVHSRRPPSLHDLEAHLRAEPTAPLIIHLLTSANAGHSGMTCSPHPHELKKEKVAVPQPGTGQGCPGRAVGGHGDKAGGFSQILNVLCSGRRAPVDPSSAHQ